MIDTKYKSADQYGKKLCDHKRKSVASDSALLKIDEIVNQNLGYTPTLALVNRVLKKENARLNPSIAANLCSQVDSSEDWITQERIFYKVNGSKSPTALLLKAMISTAAKIQQVEFFNFCYRKVINMKQRPTELMVEFAKGFLVLKNFAYGCRTMMELIEKREATEELIVFFIQALRAHDDYLAEKVYQVAVTNGFVSEQIDSAIFDPIIVVDVMEPVGLSIEATIEQPVRGLEEAPSAMPDPITVVDEMEPVALSIEATIEPPVRGLEETPIERSKSKPINERLLIKYGSIKFYMELGAFDWTVDLHGRSYEQAKLMVEGCFAAFDAYPQLGNAFSVITGIGSAHTPNYFKMQNCIMDWIKENRKDAHASQHIFNRGQLYITIERAS